MWCGPNPSFFLFFGGLLFILGVCFCWDRGLDLDPWTRAWQYFLTIGSLRRSLKYSQYVVNSWTLESNYYISIGEGEREEIEVGPGNSQIYPWSEISSSALPSIQDKLIQTIFIAFISLAKDMRGTSSDIPYCIRQWQYISQQQKHQDQFEEDIIVY